MYFIVIFMSLFMGWAQGMSQRTSQVSIANNEMVSRSAVVHETPSGQMSTLSTPFLQSKEDQNAVWSRLIKRARKILKQPTYDTCHALCGDVLEQLQRSTKNPCAIKESRAVNRLITVALFTRSSKSEYHPSLLWDELVASKKEIDAMVYHDMSAHDFALMRTLLKSWCFSAKLNLNTREFTPIIHKVENGKQVYYSCVHEGESHDSCFLNGHLCVNCQANIDNAIFGALGECCGNEVVNSGPCERCGNKLKDAMIYNVNAAALGLLEYGFPIDAQTHSEFVRWAVCYRSNYMHRKEGYVHRKPVVK